MIHTVKFVIFYNELVSHTEVCPADAAVEAGEMVGASSQLHRHLEGGDGPPAHLTLPGHSEQSHVVASTEQQPELDIQAGAGLGQPHPAAGAGEAREGSSRARYGPNAVQDTLLAHWRGYRSLPPASGHGTHQEVRQVDLNSLPCLSLGRQRNGKGYCHSHGVGPHNTA